ncbi:chemotaxis-specific protein-glutamate methyltransferase CheB [Denitromonas iodatirespirans]|uniref:Protein-glutamate methylesterase/protein-glutamine glutaminase n=1 Tax=Denitromonas iodatirespirans TaxID=2795389 RepID=A0A944D3W0_DENI1|nr:chemotaxis-specific protein-glutamate methyltransferase CheB [Denitromonas iodatirespirans]MBT0959565.1 chemotaxis-specific protein-glutamate methyltransferase CheB [Denitromonas iodatirespirans]
MSNDLPHDPSQTPPQIRVLLVDDSPLARELLRYLLESDPRLTVAGTADDGVEGVLAAQRLSPDVIVMDVHMPELDGYAAARRIMETAPTRIVMVTASTKPDDVADTFRTLEAGALAVLAKPSGPGSPNFAEQTREFLSTVRLVAEVPVVRRWPARSAPPTIPTPAPAAAPVRVVALGASTGGPQALREILSRLPGDLAAPLLIVQHISSGFTEGFAEWLAHDTGYPVRVPRAGEQVQDGIAYLAPSGCQMGLKPDGSVELTDAPAEHGVQPAVSYLFRSLAAGFGRSAVGVLLTGMGRDGAHELKAMRDAGAVTIAQNAASAIVFGMPGEAVRLKAATHVLAPPDIATMIAGLTGRRPPPDPNPQENPR